MLSKRHMTYVVTIFVGIQALAGCAKRTVSVKNIGKVTVEAKKEEVEKTDPSVYTVEEYVNNKQNYETEAPKPVASSNAVALRNTIVYGLMTDIDIAYNNRYRKIFGRKEGFAVTGDVLTLGLGAAGTIAANKATKTIFAALSTAISGTALSINKNYYAEQSFQILGIAMQIRRDKARASIEQKLQQPIASYPLNAAKRDLMAYEQAGTLEAALQELQEEAGANTAKPPAGAAAGAIAVH